MRKIAIVNQKGGVGKTTTAVNLSAGLALQGWRVVLVDLDPQANASLHLGLTIEGHEPSAYTVLVGETAFADALRTTKTLGLRVLPSNLDLSGAELELANSFGRETLLNDTIEVWERDHKTREGGSPADFLIFDCPPSLGLLSINGLAAATEVFIALQTEFFALQGMGKLVEVVQLLRRRINPDISITGIVACLYDSRLKLAREVLAEIRKYFPSQVFQRTVGTNVKLAEAPSFGQTIFEYAADSAGARDYRQLAYEVAGRSGRGHNFTPGSPADELEGEEGGSDLLIPAPHREAARSIVRAEHLPPLVPDAFGPLRRPEEAAEGSAERSS